MRTISFEHLISVLYFDPVIGSPSITRSAALSARALAPAPAYDTRQRHLIDFQQFLLLSLRSEDNRIATSLRAHTKTLRIGSISSPSESNWAPRSVSKDIGFGFSFGLFAFARRRRSCLSKEIYASALSVCVCFAFDRWYGRCKAVISTCAERVLCLLSLHGLADVRVSRRTADSGPLGRRSKRANEKSISIKFIKKTNGKGSKTGEREKTKRWQPHDQRHSIATAATSIAWWLNRSDYLISGSIENRYWSSLRSRAAFGCSTTKLRRWWQQQLLDNDQTTLTITNHRTASTMAQFDHHLLDFCQTTYSASCASVCVDIFSPLAVFLRYPTMRSTATNGKTWLRFRPSESG